MAKLLLVPWRRGLPLTVAVATSIIVTYAGRSEAWMGLWSETTNYVGIAFIFAIPAAAGAGAWVASGNRRSGLDEQARGASRSPVLVAFRQFTEPAVWVVAGYALGLAPALVATAVLADVGRPLILPLVAQLACLCGATSLGQALGSRLPWYLGAPLVAAVAYVGLGFLSFNADSILVSLTPIDERWMTFHQIAWWVLLLQTTFWAMIMLHSVLRRVSRPTLSFIALFSAGLAATPLLYVTPATRTAPSYLAAMRCTNERDLGVCLPYAKNGLRDDLTTEAGRATAALSGLFPAEIALIDDEARGSSKSADREIQEAVSQVDERREPFFMSRAGDLSATAELDVNQFHYRFIAFAIPPVTAPDPPSTGKPHASPTDLIHRWYLQNLGVPVDGTGGVGSPYLDDAFLDFGMHPDEVRAFEEAADPDRVAWFSRHAAALRSGNLTWNDFADL